MDTDSQFESPLTKEIPVADLPAHGREVSISATPQEREAMAETCGIISIEAFQADFHVAKSAGELILVTGRLSAEVTQTCCISLEPVNSKLESDVSQVFTLNPVQLDEQVDIAIEVADPPEPVVGGVIDFGALAMEHLILGLDPYPKASNVRFDQEDWAKDDEGHEQVENNPFAALAALKNPENGPKNES